MKLKVDKDVLYPMLPIMSKVSASKKGDMVLKDGLFVEVKDQKLILSSYDGYDIYVELSIPLESCSYQEGVTRLDSKLFSNIVKSLNGEILIEDTKKNLIIKNNKTRFELFSSSASDYLKKINIAKVGSSYSRYVISETTLRKSLEMASIAMSSDERKLELMSILIEFNEGGVSFVSTDGYRLVKIQEELISCDTKKETIILPSSIIMVLVGLLNGKREVEIQIDEEAICFKVDNTHIHIRRRDASKYPSVSQILERESGHIVKVKRISLLRAIEQLQIAGASVVSFNNKSIRDGVEGLVIRGAGEWAKKNILSGEVMLDMLRENNSDISVSFRNNLLRDGLRVLSSEDIDIRINGSKDFIVMRSNNQKNVLYLLLPSILY